MNDEPRQHRKYFILALLAVFIAILAYSTADEALTTAANTTAGSVNYSNYSGGWTIISDYTNKYPTQRDFGITYWNNQTKPLILSFNVVNLTATMVLNYTLLINNTIVDRQVVASGRAASFYYFIPNSSNYSITNTSSGYSANTYWYEHNISFIESGGTSGGSGGVSFDGTPVNMNGTNMFNGTISNYSTLDYTNTSLNNKVNKSGDNMTGLLSISNPNNLNIIDQNNYQTATDTQLNLYNGDYGNASYGYNTFAMHDYSNVTYFGNFFGGYKSGWNNTLKQKYPLQANDVMFYFFGKGWDGNSWTSSRARFYMQTDQAWNATSHSTKIMLRTTSPTDTTKDFTMGSDGNITVQALAGAGNDYVCVDPNGVLFRSSAAC